MQNELIEKLSSFFQENPAAEGIYVTATLGYHGCPNDLTAEHIIGKGTSSSLDKLNVNFQILMEDNREAMESLIESELIEKDEEADCYTSEDEESKVSGYLWASDFT